MLDPLPGERREDLRLRRRLDAVAPDIPDVHGGRLFEDFEDRRRLTRLALEFLRRLPLESLVEGGVERHPRVDAVRGLHQRAGRGRYFVCHSLLLNAPNSCAIEPKLLLGWNYNSCGSLCTVYLLLVSLDLLLYLLAKWTSSSPKNGESGGPRFTGLGEREEALSALEEGCKQRQMFLQPLKVHPAYDDLRNEPRFTASLQQMGLMNR